MKFFEYSDYRKLLGDQLKKRGRNGFGEAIRLAKHLGIQSSLISQVLGGSRHFTFDQACGVTEFLRFNELETDFFLALVNFERAGAPSAKRKCKKDLEKFRDQARSLENRISSEKAASEFDGGVFFSQWYHSAIKLLSSMAKYQSSKDLAQALGLNLRTAENSVETLIRLGLLKIENGKILPTVSNIHIPKGSPFLPRHHQNWRIQGFRRMDEFIPEDRFFTVPATVSEKDFEKISNLLSETIVEVIEIIDASRGESLICFNLDLFKLV